jgi:hypothetical protein
LRSWADFQSQNCRDYTSAARDAEARRMLNSLRLDHLPDVVTLG